MEKRSSAATGIERETPAGFRMPCLPAANQLESTRVSHFPPMPEATPAQITVFRKLLPTIGQDPESLAACFGRQNKKRAGQINSGFEFNN